MPRAIWTGTLSFGLVAVPVRLYPAVRKKDVRLHELDRLTGQRVRHRRVAMSLPAEPPAPLEWTPSGARVRPELPPVELPARREGPAPQAERPLSPEEVVSGFEVAPGRYVTLERRELEALAPDRSRVMDIEQFADVVAVDPVYYETSYTVVPEADHRRSYGLLVDAMRRTGKLGIGWIVLRRKRHLAALRPYGRVLLLSTLLFADEIVPPAEPDLPSDFRPKEREMAELLVNTLAGPFEPERYRDQYRERLLALIEGRAASARQVTPPTLDAVPDLMAALRASIEQARRQRGKWAARSKPAHRHRRKTA